MELINTHQHTSTHQRQEYTTQLETQNTSYILKRYRYQGKISKYTLQTKT